jgi:hypothetical protein
VDKWQETAKTGPTTTSLKAAVHRRYRREAVTRALDLGTHFDFLTTSIVCTIPLSSRRLIPQHHKSINMCPLLWSGRLQ